MTLYTRRCDVIRRIDVDTTSFWHQIPTGIDVHRQTIASSALFCEYQTTLFDKVNSIDEVKEWYINITVFSELTRKCNIRNYSLVIWMPQSFQVLPENNSAQWVLRHSAKTRMALMALNQ